MSDSDSLRSTPRGAATRSLKKRRLEDSEAGTQRSSSPDELEMSGGGHKPAPRQAGRTKRRDSVSHQSLHDRNPSPDELGYVYSDSESQSEPSRPRSNSSRSEPSSPESAERLGSASPPPKPRKVRFKLKRIMGGHKRGVSQVKFSPDGRWIASCSADATIKIWDAMSGMLMQTLEGHLAGVSTVAWAPDSKTLASGSDDKTIRLWDRATGKPYPVPLVGHHNYVFSLAFSPKGNMLVSGSYDEAVFLWDVRAGRQMRSLPAHSDPVGGVDFVRDGALVASCSTDGLIRIWDTATGQCLRTLVHEDNAPVVAVRFAPNGKFILAWTLDGSIRLWDYIEGQCKKTYQGHENKKYGIGGAFGVYGIEGFVVSGSEDGRILLWDVKSKNILQNFNAHEGVVLSVDTHPFLDMIVSGGLDNVVKIWTNDDDQEDEQEFKQEYDEVKGKDELDIGGLRSPQAEEVIQ